MVTTTTFIRHGGRTMPMGRRKQERQDALFVMAGGLPRSPGHPLYRKLNELLAETGFDRWIEARCQRYDATEEKRGQVYTVAAGTVTFGWSWSRREKPPL